MAAVLVINPITVISEIRKTQSSDKSLFDTIKELLDKRFWWGPASLSRARDVVEKCFCITFSLLLLASELLQRTAGLGKNLVNSLSDHRIYLVILVFYSLVLAKHSLKKRAVTAFAEVAVMGVMILKRSTGGVSIRNALVFFLLLVLIHDIGARTFIKIYTAFLSAIYVLLAALSSFGVIGSGDVSDMASRGNVSGPLQIRYSFCWGHPNTA